ncbi:hypothetical protein MBLNU230_g1946t1 [Neophaeotheca triangularis]
MIETARRTSPGFTPRSAKGSSKRKPSSPLAASPGRKRRDTGTDGDEATSASQSSSELLEPPSQLSSPETTPRATVKEDGKDQTANPIKSVQQHLNAAKDHLEKASSDLQPILTLGSDMRRTIKNQDATIASLKQQVETQASTIDRLNEFVRQIKELETKTITINTLRSQLDEQSKTSAAKLAAGEEAMEKALEEVKAASSTALQELHFKFQCEKKATLGRHAAGKKRTGSEHDKTLHKLATQHSNEIAKLHAARNNELKALQTRIDAEKKLIRDECEAELDAYKKATEQRLTAYLNRREGLRKRKNAVAKRRALAWEKLASASDELMAMGVEEGDVEEGNIQGDVGLREAMGGESLYQGRAVEER